MATELNYVLIMLWSELNVGTNLIRATTGTGQGHWRMLDLLIKCCLLK